MASPDPRTDEQLIAAANRGDATAFEALYYRYREWVVGHAFRVLGDRDEALDVLQEAFAYFFGKFPGFHLTARLTTFLYPAVRNLSLGRLRKRRRTVYLGDADEVVVGEPVERGSPPGSELTALLASLSETDREVILLRFVDGLALKEMAAALEIPLGTVKSRLHNALDRLRRDPRTKKYFEA